MNQSSMAHLYQTQIGEIEQNKRMKKTEDLLNSIITVLIDIFDINLTCNVRWDQMSFL